MAFCAYVLSEVSSFFYDHDKATKISLCFPDKPGLGQQMSRAKHLQWNHYSRLSPGRNPLMDHQHILLALGHKPSSLAQNPRHGVLSKS